MTDLPRHKYDYVDCFHRKVCWEIGEYSECSETPCEDYIKKDRVVLKI